MSGLGKRSRKLLVGVFALVIAGCGEMKEESTPEATVEMRSKAYWEAMIAGEYGTAYQYFSPGYRARISKDAFAMRFMGKTRWNGIDIKAVQCDEQRCELTASADFTFLGNAQFPSHDNSVKIEESWVRDGDDWWLVPRR